MNPPNSDSTNSDKSSSRAIPTAPERPVVVAITGASGVAYGVRLLQVLIGANVDVHLTISESARLVIQHEMGLALNLDNFRLDKLIPGCPPSAPVHYHHFRDFMAPIASGSHQTRGMVVCPCSGSTLSGIATAASGNLIQRAADVHLKERRPLILVPRETPLSLIQIRNMETICLAGGTILPASPGFYQGGDSVEQLIDFVVARILDQLGLENHLTPRWGATDA